MRTGAQLSPVLSRHAVSWLTSSRVSPVPAFGIQPSAMAHTVRPIARAVMAVRRRPAGERSSRLANCHARVLVGKPMKLPLLIAAALAAALLAVGAGVPATTAPRA